MSQLVDEIEQFIADDMAVLRQLMHEVKGLSIVSAVPAIEEAQASMTASEQFEFE